MTQISNTLSTGSTAASMYTSYAQQKEDAAQSQQANSTTKSINATSTSQLITDQAASDTEIGISAAYSVEISQQGSLLNTLNSSTNDKQSSAGISSASSPDTAAGATSSLGEVAKTSSTVAPSGVAPSGEASSDSSDDDSEATSSASLSQYSESQLKEMLNSGEITQSEYSAEITKREQDEEQENETSNATNTAIDTAQ
ncbi:MAG: hypothetical protein H6Q69_3312 [Firmicutes bacterium]|nr:hypothetical protein [Bacillota bacterium]